MRKEIVLKPGREKSLHNRHPWIFSGAVQAVPKTTPGEIVRVLSSTKEILGYGYINPHCDILIRMLTFFECDDHLAKVRDLIIRAIEMRKTLFGDLSKSAVRLIHAESDQLPGLVVDLYGKTAVLQSSTAGIDRLKQLIVDTLRSQLTLDWIYEKSNSPSRAVEKCLPVQQTLYGDSYTPVVIEEEGISHLIPIETGQKSGFFIDQREMRSLIRRLSPGKRVLNCFSYTGGFSLAALRGGASSCTSVDCSSEALAILEENLKINHLSPTNHTSVCADCFEFLRADALDYEIIILDPPAFAKKKKDVSQAMKGYRDINLQVMRKAKPGTLLLTASCSYFMEEEVFRKVLFQAALAAGRQVQILSHHIHAFDHPESVFVPETAYLKSFLLRIN